MLAANSIWTNGEFISRNNRGRIPTSPAATRTTILLHAWHKRTIQPRSGAATCCPLCIGQPRNRAGSVASVPKFGERGTECPSCCQLGCQCQRRYPLVSPESTRYSPARIAATSFRFRACLFACIESMYRSPSPPLLVLFETWGNPTTSQCFTAVIMSH